MGFTLKVRSDSARVLYFEADLTFQADRQQFSVV
jgi:hypothetical protein